MGLREETMNAVTPQTIQDRLRERLVIVPKPGTEWRDPGPNEWITSTIGGTHKVGDDAGLHYQPSFNFAAKPKLRPHVYAGEPLAYEAAAVIDALAAKLKKAREWLQHNGNCPRWDTDERGGCVPGTCECGLEGFLRELDSGILAVKTNE